VFFCYKSFSQDISISKGEIIKDRQFLIDKNEITASDEIGNFISVRPHRINGTLRNYFIEFFDNLNFSERQEVETNNNTEILDVFIKNDKIHILIKEYDNKNASIRIDLFDLNDKNLFKKNLVATEKDENKDLYDAIKNDNFFTLNHSNNYLLSFPVVADKTIYTHLEFYDDDLNHISTNIVFPDESINKRKASYLNTFVYNNKVYILYSLVNEDDEKYYQLTEYAKNQSRDLILPIDKDIYELVNVKISGSNHIISGLFSKRKKGAFEGFTYYNINLETFKLTSKKLSYFLSENARKYFIGLFKGNRSIDIKDIFIDESGNTYLVAQFYTIVKQYIPIGIPIASFASASFTAYISYNPFSISYKIYDDMLISKINSNGELIWDNVFELRQTEKIHSKSNKKDSSYHALFYNNELHILMNGFINLEKDKLKMIQDKRNSKTNFYNITVKPDGVIVPNIIFSNADSDILFRAEGSVESNNSIFNLGQGNMIKQLLKLKL
jgi:hypothetical protein